MMDMNIPQELDFLRPVVESAHKAYPPDWGDLLSIYRILRAENRVSALEFGSGWSSLVIASALASNQADGNITFRHPHPFWLTSIEASDVFANETLRMAKLAGVTNLSVHVSKVSMSTHAGVLCHVFDQSPLVTADFIYLDGPDAYQVQGEVRGLSVSFGDSEKTYGLPMSADILLQESTFWPGTRILTDGRGGNARFLATHLSRNWKYSYDSEQDQHSFLLVEPHWGRHSQGLLDHLNVPELAELS